MIPLLLALGCSAPPGLHVLAASSLTEVIGDLEAVYEAAHPEVDVAVSTAGSQTLRLQVEHGLAADVFVSADTGHVHALVDAELARAARRVARNRLVVAVRADSPLATVEDLSRAERLVLGTAEVPVGAYADAMLARGAAAFGTRWRARVDAHVVSREPSVRLVLAKVALGEADAAVVYATDVRAVGGLRAIEVPAALAPPTDVVAAALTGSPDAARADDWLAFLDGDAARAALLSRGFTVDPR